VPAIVVLSLVSSLGCQPAPKASEEEPSQIHLRLDGLKGRVVSLERKLLILERRMVQLVPSNESKSGARTIPVAGVESLKNNITKPPDSDSPRSAVSRIGFEHWVDLLKFKEKHGLSAQQTEILVGIMQSELAARKVEFNSGSAKSRIEGRRIVRRLREKYQKEVEKVLGKEIGGQWRIWRDQQIQRARSKVRKAK